MDVADGQESFPVRTTRRISKALSTTSKRGSQAIRKTSVFAQQQIKRTSKFATDVDSGMNKMGIYENRFQERRSSRQLLKKKEEISITTLMYLYKFRQKLQKVEFLVTWTCFFAMIASLLIDNKEILDQVYTVSFIYVQLSVFSRIFAYIMDFANAAVKLATDDGSMWSAIPLWLILHHGGVLASHTMIAFFFIGPEVTTDNLLKILFGLVTTQSSHNTWTKKYSLTLYWGNVILGFLCLCFITDLSIKNTSGRAGGTTILLCGVFSTLCGVLLLANSAAKKSKTQAKTTIDRGKNYGSINLGVTKEDEEDNNGITEEEEKEIGRVSAKLSLIV